MNPWSLISAGYQDLRQPPPGNRPCLDVLRTLAIALVIATHIGPYCTHALRALRTPVVLFGWTGVDLFFVLSGVLIGGQLWKELKASATVDVGRFVLRRGFRIWPLYYFLIAFLAVQHIVWRVARPGLWIDMTFLCNYLPTRHQVSGAWSLSTEEQFYLLIPVLLMLGAKRFSLRSLVALSLGWFAALPVIRFFVLLHYPPGASTNFNATMEAIYFPFHTHSDGLALGLLIAWIMTWRSEWLGKGRWLDAVLAVAFLGGCWLWYSIPLTFLFSLVAITYGALTVLLLRVPERFMYLSKPFYVTSRLSYGVYLIHAGLLVRAMPYLNRSFGVGFRSFAYSYALCTAVSFALAFVSFSFIELPFLKLRSRFLAKNRVAAASSEEALPAAPSIAV
jgi:peptidoglycan/LPS O-acetylase OafA/YrhL